MDQGKMKSSATGIARMRMRAEISHASPGRVRGRVEIFLSVKKGRLSR